MRRHGGNAIAIRRIGCSVLLAVTAAPSLAHAQATISIFTNRVDTGQLVLLSAMLGAIIFAVLSAIQLLRARNRSENENQRLRLKVGDLKAIADHAAALVHEADPRHVA